MIEVEKARRLFLANLNKKQEELTNLVNIVSGWIEKEASSGSPGLSFDKTMFDGYELLDDESMMHIATYFKAKGYYVNISAKLVSKDGGDMEIKEVFIAWVDILSMINKDYIEKQLK